ncbi:MAG: UpxY family transcription antiterminator [Acidobacteriia bacterium]|nr:UpxY family transcription antiterminator [Terriglobia bacterium]
MHSVEPSPTNDEAMPQAGAAGHWHAVHTRYQHEKTVVQALSSKGHTVFLPLYGATHLWRRRAARLQLPLFPGYLFLQGGLDRQLQILSTPGVVALVKSGGHPAIVPQEQIAAVRQLVENSSQVEPHDYLHSGDRMMVTSGSLQGIEGILIRTKGAFRLVVSMELLGRAAAVEIDVSCVQRLCQPLLAARPRRFAAIA